MIKVRPFKVDMVHVWIKCPFCKKIHRHGSCGGSGYAGFRVPHCKDKNYGFKEYYIEDIGDAKE